MCRHGGALHREYDCRLGSLRACCLAIDQVDLARDAPLKAFKRGESGEFGEKSWGPLTCCCLPYLPSVLVVCVGVFSFLVEMVG